LEFINVMVSVNGKPAAVPLNALKLERISLRKTPVCTSTFDTWPPTVFEPSDGNGPCVSVEYRTHEFAFAALLLELLDELLTALALELELEASAVVPVPAALSPPPHPARNAVALVPIIMPNT
jgi:hypothetical protein